MARLLHFLSCPVTKNRPPFLPELLGIFFASEPKSLYPREKVRTGAKPCGQHQRRYSQEPPSSGWAPGGNTAASTTGGGGRCQHSCPRWGAGQREAPVGGSSSFCVKQRLREKGGARAGHTSLWHTSCRRNEVVPLQPPPHKPCWENTGKEDDPMVPGILGKVLSLSNSY